MQDFSEVLELEYAETDRRTTKGNPVVIRLDGKNFSTWTSNLRRPFDARLSNLMVDTAKFLARETNAVLAYTQSDEITIVLYAEGDSNIYFDGRIQKLSSVLAAMASVFFNNLCREVIPEKIGFPAFFDCRVFEVPSKELAINSILSRTVDGIRNSINNAGRTYFSHSSMMNKPTFSIRKRLVEEGSPWETMPNCYKYGTYILKQIKFSTFTTAELAKLPPRHKAHTNPDLIIERKEFVTNHELGWESFTTLANPIETVFG